MAYHAQRIESVPFLCEPVANREMAENQDKTSNIGVIRVG